MKEEKKQVVLNLSLPLIEIDANDAWNNDHYQESGMFFVKTKDGCYHLVEVDTGNNANELCLFPNICNLLNEQRFALSIKEELKMMFNNMFEKIQSGIIESEMRVSSEFSKIEERFSEDKDTIIEKLEESVEKLKQSPSEDTSKVIQGYISESALVDVLRTIK